MKYAVVVQVEFPIATEPEALRMQRGLQQALLAISADSGYKAEGVILIVKLPVDKSAN